MYKNFHKIFGTHGVGKISFVLFLVAIIIAAAEFSMRQGSEILLDEVSMQRIPREETRSSIFKKVADDAVIFSTGKQVLKRRDELLNGEKTFLFADLVQMKITFYKNGMIAHSGKIRAKGKEGTLSETPNGEYRIRSKEEKHFSKIAKVWMPLSMYFYGNYFIHGWPYTPEGKPVSNQFSGGCVSLPLQDAEYLFKNVPIGTTVLIYAGKESVPSRFTYFHKINLKERPLPPYFSAASVLAADVETGRVLFSRRIGEVYPIGPIAKLMAVLIASESLDDQKLLRLDSRLLNMSSQASFSEEWLAVGELFYPLLLSSSSDIAFVFNQYVNNFVGRMNEKSRAIGLSSTHFAEGGGTSLRTASSSQDIFKLLRYIWTSRKPILEASAVPERTARSPYTSEQYHWVNKNWAPEDKRFVGGVGGETVNGREVMAGIFNLQFSEFETRPIAIVLLESYDRMRDINALIQYMEENFVYGTVLSVREEPGPKVIQVGASIYGALEGLRSY